MIHWSVLRKVRYPDTTCRGDGDFSFGGEVVIMKLLVFDSAGISGKKFPIRPQLGAELEYLSDQAAVSRARVGNVLVVILYLVSGSNI